jgi:purine nucleoside phosphorylase
VPEQLVDYTHGRPASFEGAAGTDGPHVDFGRPFDAALVARLVAAAAAAGLPLVRGGTYGVTQGPRLETAAEIDRLERDGCSLVGMTAMPEAVLARELRLPYALVCGGHGARRHRGARRRRPAPGRSRARAVNPFTVGALGSPYHGVPGYRPTR